MARDREPSLVITPAKNLWLLGGLSGGRVDDRLDDAGAWGEFSPCG